MIAARLLPLLLAVAIVPAAAYPQDAPPPGTRAAATDIAAADIPATDFAAADIAASDADKTSADATYADLADLADSAALVVRARVRALARVEDARAPGLRPGTARFYVTADTVALLAGDAAVGPRLAFLADLPLDPRGRPPPLRRRDIIAFAAAVPGHPDQLALTAPDAMLTWSPAVETRLRAILTALLAPGAPARITGVREATYVPGALAGEGETQVFLATADGSAASLTIVHAPGQPARWGASFSELTADTAAPIRRDTLAWYRLACALPAALPAAAELSPTAQAQAQAREDYRTVLAGLGACGRRRSARG